MSRKLIVALTMMGNRVQVIPTYADVQAGLAIHKAFEVDGLYSLSHEATGRVLARCVAKEAAEALRAELIDLGFDWTQDVSMAQAYAHPVLSMAGAMCKALEAREMRSRGRQADNDSDVCMSDL